MKCFVCWRLLMGDFLNDFNDCMVKKRNITNIGTISWGNGMMNWKGFTGKMESENRKYWELEKGNGMGEGRG